jgi:hypothetical protein
MIIRVSSAGLQDGDGVVHPWHKISVADLDTGKPIRFCTFVDTETGEYEHFEHDDEWNIKVDENGPVRLRGRSKLDVDVTPCSREECKLCEPWRVDQPFIVSELTSE